MMLCPLSLFTIIILHTFSISLSLSPLIPYPLPSSYVESHGVAAGRVTQSKIAAVAGDYMDGAHLAALLRRQPKGMQLQLFYSILLFSS